MNNLPEIETEADLLSQIKTREGNTLTEKDISKLISTGYTKSPENIIEIAGLFDNIGIKETIKFLEENKGQEFITLLRSSPNFTEARRKYFLDITAPFRSIANVIEGIYTCPKCGSKKVTTVQKQTRSSDEPTTEFNSCVCGNTWRG